MSTYAGISGYTRNATAALVSGAGLVGVCEDGRVTRIRDAGVKTTGFPDAALQVLLRQAGLDRDGLELVAAETALLDCLPPGVRLMDHHLAHAGTAFLTSPFDDAAIVVCDTDASRELSVWTGDDTRLTPVEIGWRGPAFAGACSRLTRALGMQAGSDEYVVESLARLDGGRATGRADALLTLGDEGLTIDPAFDAWAGEAAEGSPEAKGRVAGMAQRRLGELMIELLGRVREQTGARHACFGGGCFFNTYFNSVIRDAGVFDATFVSNNPGNGGLSAGSALVRALERGDLVRRPTRVSSFLGPSFSHEEIKGVLDNCKLRYDFVDDSGLVAAAVQALARGELVGWFSGRMEWGTRALGNRSILANPFSPYVLENLNGFLKHRQPYRTYGVSVAAEHADALFDGPATSPFMECDYRLREPERFAHLLPPGVATLRVQTVGSEPVLLRDVLEAFGRAAGSPVLVNTSFNGFHEPIVCSPRDAVRVFFGSGLDVLMLGNFILRK